MLGLVRGTLEGSPLNDQFPIAKNAQKIVGQNEGQVFGKNAYATEGWCIPNRGWKASVTFATLGSMQIKAYDAGVLNLKFYTDILVWEGKSVSLQIDPV